AVNLENAFVPLVASSDLGTLSLLGFPSMVQLGLPVGAPQAFNLTAGEYRGNQTFDDPTWALVFSRVTPFVSNVRGDLQIFTVGADGLASGPANSIAGALGSSTSMRLPVTAADTHRDPASLAPPLPTQVPGLIRT